MTPGEFASRLIVPRGTMDRLEEMDRVLMDWSQRHNLIAKSTIKDRWQRHYFDSVQLVSLLPEDFKTLADLGSGAGFPGLVLAAFYPEKKVSLIESTGKKAAFLTAAAEAMGLSNVRVIPARIESLKLESAPDIITARALARLDKLLAYGAGIQGKSTRYFLLKGQDVEGELTEAAKCWHMSVIRHPSLSSPDGTILEIGNVKRVAKG
jgi:16S rRNA (guanine527-N7)-methyltransferase